MQPKILIVLTIPPRPQPGKSLCIYLRMVSCQGSLLEWNVRLKRVIICVCRIGKIEKYVFLLIIIVKIRWKGLEIMQLGNVFYPQIPWLCVSHSLTIKPKNTWIQICSGNEFSKIFCFLRICWHNQHHQGINSTKSFPPWVGLVWSLIFSTFSLLKLYLCCKSPLL